jgi:CheY-like chemotaxis protein/signal transduction histidine kinase
MRLSLRTKLTAIVATAGIAFVVLIVASTLIASGVEDQLTTVQDRLLPKAELGPRLQVQFEQLRRSLQDAVAANDPEAVTATSELKDGLLEQLATFRGAVDPVQASRLDRSVDQYYGAAVEVSRRLLAGETGEGLVAAMADMQTKHTRTIEQLRSIAAFDRNELTSAFSAIASAQATARRVRMAISIACLILVMLLSFWLSRGVLVSVRALTAGLKRFARGDFADEIGGVGTDELGEVATQANQMAASLRQLAEERDRADWLRNGQAALAQELRGELDPEDAAGRSLRVIARTVGARAGALYYTDSEETGTLSLLARYAWSANETENETGTVSSFRPGEGLVGQASLRDEIMVVNDPPPDYLRIRSSLGEGAPRAIVLLPISRAGRVKGVLELGLFVPWSERGNELLLSIRETLAIGIEVAQARAATRRLLRETQVQAQRLASQEEKLLANNEELQTQQEELQQTNDELTQQTEELDAQRLVLEERNTDLDRVRRDLERKAAELTTVSAYKSQFLANMSHELRTPLNSMLLLSNLLAGNDTGTLTEKQVEYARTIYSAGRDLLALINQVLDLAKIEAGKHQVHIASMTLDDLVTSVERVFQPLAHDKGLRLSTEIGPDLPATILTDRLRTEQILNNLLANAIKFTERGEVVLRIQKTQAWVKFKRGDLSVDDSIALIVADTGLGIAPEDQERIFEPFEQVDAAPDRRYGGTGLGLNIARELSHLLGGELQMQSLLGKGSTFTCYLPLSHQSRQSDSSVSRDRAEAVVSPVGAVVSSVGAVVSTAVRDDEAVRASDGSRPNRTQDATLLIIEDDRRFAEAFGEVIEAQGLRYRIARDGRTGIEMARDKHQRPTGIILDVMLPDIDGWTVMQELRADPETAAIPVHFVSAVDAPEHGASLGAVGYLIKPATKRDLLHVIESLAPMSSRRKCRILVVENNTAPGESVAARLVDENLDLERVSTAHEALERLEREPFACMVLDLSLPDMDGLEFLRLAREKCGSETPPVVVYTGRALSKAEVRTLQAHAEAVVLKGGSASERLLDEVRMFVERLNRGLGPRRRDVPRLHPADPQLAGRKVLVVDDDMRTVYALSAMLRANGVDVLVADNGQAAIDVLNVHPDFEAVLMDITMPEMDGYEAMRRIRGDRRFGALPIVALTARAMKGDEERCIEAGATAYLPKPIDPDRLVAMLHSLFAEDRNRRVLDAG